MTGVFSLDIQFQDITQIGSYHTALYLPVLEDHVAPEY